MQEFAARDCVVRKLEAQIYAALRSGWFSEENPCSMKSVIGKTFATQDVPLDGVEFIDCEFKDCRFVYTGGTYRFRGCEINNCDLAISGTAARTVELLQFFGWRRPQKAVPGEAKLAS